MRCELVTAPAQEPVTTAEAKLFAGRSYCVIPAPEASEGAVRVVTGIAQLIGARPFFIDAEEHDRYVAAVSHLPLVLSTALFTLARGSPAWPELSSLAGTGFLGATRLASTDAELSHDICLTNREAVLHWLDRMVEEAEELGANAVVDVRFTTASMMQGAAELLAFGTAVVVEDAEPQ